MHSKLCYKCGIEKDISGFSPGKARQPHIRAMCRKCKNKRYRELRKIYPEKYKSYTRLYRTSLSQKEYYELLKDQKGKCAICEGTSKNKELAVDHSHKTNKIRGLLCDTCNRALGMFKDDVKLLQKAIEYLNA